MKNYYEILQVNEKASSEIIEKAYKVLVKKYHPDLQKDIKKKELLEDKKISTLNNSRYLLVELPMNNKIVDVEDILFNLVRINVIPIIAHPERYSYVQDNIKYLDGLKELGVLFQGNYESLFGKYGTNAKKTLKKLIKLNYISFLGSDMHRLGYKYHQEKVAKKY